MSDQTDKQIQKPEHKDSDKTELPSDILEEVTALRQKVGNLEKIMDDVITNVKNK